MGKNEFYSIGQLGFWHPGNTMGQFIKLERDIKKGFFERPTTMAIFLDLEQACEQYWREATLLKIRVDSMESLQIHKELFTRQVFHGKSREWGFARIYTRKHNTAVSVIFPTIFIILVNDLNEEIMHDDKTGLSQYAANCTVRGSGRYDKAVKNQVQRQLSWITNWMEKWGFKINAEKAVNLIFNRVESGTIRTATWGYRVRGLQRVTHKLFLEIIRDEKKLSWTNHIDNVLKQGERTKPNPSNKMMRVGVHTATMITFYKSFVRGRI